MLRERLVCGIASGSIQRRLLAEPELTLQKAQNLAQAIESTDKNAKDLQGQRQPPMTAVNAVTYKRGPPREMRARTDAGKPMETLAIDVEGSTHLEIVASKTPFVTRVRSDVIWLVCRSKRTQSTAAGRYGDGRKQPQQTHALESETSSSASE